MANTDNSTDRRALLATAILAAGAAAPLAASAAAQDGPAAGGSKHDLAGLADKIRQLDHAIGELGAGGFGDTLIGIIHHPAGWTTIAEFELVESTVVFLQRQVGLINDQYAELARAARKVGQG